MTPNPPRWTPERAEQVKKMLDRLLIRPPYTVGPANQSERIRDALTFGTDEIIELLRNAEDMYACLAIEKPPAEDTEPADTFTATQDDSGRWEFRDTRLNRDLHIKWDGSNPCAIIYKGERRLNHLDILIEDTVAEQAKARLDHIVEDTRSTLAGD